MQYMYKLSIIHAKITLIFTCLSYLVIETCAIRNAFVFEDKNLFYTTKYSNKDSLQVLSINKFEKSNFSISVGGQRVASFNISEKDEGLRVNVYAESYNPSLKDTAAEIKLKMICEFLYPVTVVAGSDSYQCSLSYRDKSGQHHSVGKCGLTLQYKRSLCLVYGSVFADQLSNRSHVNICGTIYHCNSRCKKDGDLHWRAVVNSTLSLPLVSWSHIIWIQAFLSQSINVGILVGIPKNPINKSNIFEIPLRLRKSVKNTKISYISLQINTNKEVIVEEVTKVGCFQNLDHKTYDEKEAWVTYIEFSKEDPCTSDDFDLLGILRLPAKEEGDNIEMKVKIDSIVFENDSRYNGSIDKSVVQSSVDIPLFHGRHSIIPVIKNPIILPSFETRDNRYVFEEDDIFIYFVYDDTQFIDVSSKVKCRPFDPARLKCPDKMASLDTVLKKIENPESTKWSLELMIEKTSIIVTVQPLIWPEPSWEMTFPDAVLNLISGWKGTRRRPEDSLLNGDKCEPIYQISSVQIHKKMILYNKAKDSNLELNVDMSETMYGASIRVVPPGQASIHRAGNRFLIQARESGNLNVELLSMDQVLLSRVSMTVLTTPVSVTDLHVSCISHLKVFNQSLFSSTSATLTDFRFTYSDLGSSRRCFFLIDVVFSDQSKSDILLFRKDQYSLRFVTNTNIIEVSGPETMWYDPDRFNNERSFHVELLESNFCESPKRIFKKLVTLATLSPSPDTRPGGSSKKSSSNITKTQGPSSTLTKISRDPSETQKTTTSTKVGDQEKDASATTKSLKWIIFILIAVFSLILVVIVTNLGVKYHRRRKSFLGPGYGSQRRRKSITGVEIRNMLGTGDVDYPPLLPPPGPQVQLSDTDAVAISSPHSFWCADPKKQHQNGGSSRVAATAAANPFVRQSSLPVKGCASRGDTGAPCPPSRVPQGHMMMMHTLLGDSYGGSQGHMNTLGRRDDDNITDRSLDMAPFSPMTWSVTHMDVEESSGVGSLTTTNMEDTIKDPYGSRERFHKLSELPCSLTSRQKERIYDMI